jgi:hypothetical protein
MTFKTISYFLDINFKFELLQRIAKGYGATLIQILRIQFLLDITFKFYVL